MHQYNGHRLGCDSRKISHKAAGLKESLQLSFDLLWPGRDYPVSGSVYQEQAATPLCLHCGCPVIRRQLFSLRILTAVLVLTVLGSAGRQSLCKRRTPP